MRRYLVTGAAAVAALVLTPVTALADDDDRRARGPSVSRYDAIQIARSFGIVRITEIERDDGGWEIEGRDRRGREIEVEINRNGRVTDVDRDDDDDYDDDDDD